MAPRSSTKNSLPPWHPKILIPSVVVGLPLSYGLRYIVANTPKKWRDFPAKLPHLILLWIQQLVTWTSETFSLQTLVLMWFGLLFLIYMLPTATRPDFEEMRLNRELEELEREVKELAEEIGGFEDDEDFQSTPKPAQNKKTEAKMKKKKTQ